jgi:hypothetical protein
MLSITNLGIARTPAGKRLSLIAIFFLIFYYVVIKLMNSRLFVKKTQANFYYDEKGVVASTWTERIKDENTFENKGNYGSNNPSGTENDFDTEVGIDKDGKGGAENDLDWRTRLRKANDDLEQWISDEISKAKNKASADDIAYWAEQLKMTADERESGRAMTDEQSLLKLEEMVAKFAYELRPRKDISGTKKIFLSTLYGGFCNKALALANALEEARRQEQVLVLDFFWLLFIAVNFDAELLFARSGASIELRWAYDKTSGAPRLGDGTLRFHSGAGLYCSGKTSLDVVRTALRPRKELRVMAKKELEKLRSDGAEVIMAVHVRNLDRPINDPHDIGNGEFCHEQGTHGTRVFYRPDDYALSPSLINLAKKEFPEIKSWNKIGIFLSTDNQRGDVDKTFFDKSIWEKTGVVAALTTRQHGAYRGSLNIKGYVQDETSMVQDMWSNTLSDIFVAHPSSSCESFVTQWRTINKPIPYPKTCWEKYLDSEFQGDGRDLCRHGFRIALYDDGVSLSPCEMIISIAGLMEIARDRMRLLLRPVDIILWGSNLDFIERYLDIDHLRETAKARGILLVPFRTGQFKQLKLSSISSVSYSDFTTRGIKPQEILNKYLGKSIDALRLGGIRPNLSLMREAETNSLFSSSKPVVIQAKDQLPPGGQKVCCDPTVTTQSILGINQTPDDFPSIKQDEHSTLLHVDFSTDSNKKQTMLNLWLATIAQYYECRNPGICSQVVAHFRARDRSIDMIRMIPHSCFKACAI